MRFSNIATACILIVGGVLAIGAWDAAGAATGDSEPDLPAEFAKDIKILRQARNLLREAFLDAGYASDDARMLADRSMDLLRNIPVEPYTGPFPADTPTILDPDSAPMLVIAGQLEAEGQSREDALQWAIAAYVAANGIEDDPTVLGLDVGCSAFQTVISWCETIDGITRVKSKRTLIDSNCMNEKIKPCLPALMPACVDPDVPFVEVPLKSNPAGCQLATGNATCIVIRLPLPGEEPYIFDCDDVFGCECIDVDAFQQTCALTVHCCTKMSGDCGGCPCTGHGGD